jgi:hypothetical protein
MNGTQARAGIGPVQVGAVLLALVTAGIHFYLFPIEGHLGFGTISSSAKQLVAVG